MGTGMGSTLEQYTRHNNIRPHNAAEVLCNNLKTQLLTWSQHAFSMEKSWWPKFLVVDFLKRVLSDATQLLYSTKLLYQDGESWDCPRTCHAVAFWEWWWDSRFLFSTAKSKLRQQRPRCFHVFPLLCKQRVCLKGALLTSVRMVLSQCLVSWEVLYLFK